MCGLGDLLSLSLLQCLHLQMNGSSSIVKVTQVLFITAEEHGQSVSQTDACYVSNMLN
jgi:hypothetical protein